MALIGKLIIDHAPIKKTHIINKYYKTATDVLRLITLLSDGDVSLAEETKYTKLKRKERRMMMDLLNGCGNLLEDMFRYRERWLRVGEIIHPSEWSRSALKRERYSKVLKAFNDLRNEKKPLFFAGQVQEAIKSGDIATATKLLKQRPGEFARSLDKLLRDSDNKNYVVNTFNDIATKVSVPVLLQVKTHFRERNNEHEYRIFFPKGQVAKANSIKNELPLIDDQYCKAVVNICESAIKENFMSKEFMGRVYIDEQFKDMVVPFSQRSSNSGSRILTRGSKYKIGEDAKTIRSFIWWTNTLNGRVDIDLSAAIFDEKWNYLEHISYTRLRSQTYNSYHSGDITNGYGVDSGGVAEFLDVDIESVAKTGRYVCFQVYSYTQQPFNKMPNCRFGWMERQDVNSGEIFEPQTVINKFDLTSASTVCIPVIFDCKNKEFIWCDMNLNIDSCERYYRGNNVESNIRGVSAVCYGLTNLVKPDLYDLVRLNAIARGEIVTDRNEADIIFSNDNKKPIKAVEDIVDDEKIITFVENDEVPIISSFDLDYIMGQLL